MQIYSETDDGDCDMKSKQRKWMYVVATAILITGAHLAPKGYSGQTTTICHRGYTITVSSALLQLHLAHGDIQGPCQVTECKNR